MPSLRHDVRTPGLNRPLLWFLGTGALLAGSMLCAQEASNKPLARVDGQTITESEVMARAADALENVEAGRKQCLMSADQKQHDVLQQTAQVLVRERLLESAAGKAGQDREEWLKAELERQKAALTDAQVDQFFERNKGRLGNAKREQIEPQVRQYLANQAVYDKLEEAAAIEYLLEPYRVDVAAMGPVRGKEGAPVTIVEFSDFQCPYCRQVVPTLEQALAKYDGKVKLVYRQFPLSSIHPNALKAAEASLCAKDQGKFWELHDLMFEEQSTLTVDELQEKAKRLGLATDKFAECLSSGSKSEAVRNDLKAGASVGVNGTPALFVNGRPMSGAVSIDQLSEVIDAELKRSGS